MAGPHDVFIGSKPRKRAIKTGRKQSDSVGGDQGCDFRGRFGSMTWAGWASASIDKIQRRVLGNAGRSPSMCPHLTAVPSGGEGRGVAHAARRNQIEPLISMSWVIPVVMPVCQGRPERFEERSAFHIRGDGDPAARPLDLDRSCVPIAERLSSVRYHLDDGNASDAEQALPVLRKHRGWGSILSP